MNREIAIGDIHGCINTLRVLVEDVIRLEKSDTLYILGDCINRGTNSKQVLDYLLALQKTHNIQCIRGNHEHKFLMAFDCGFDFFERFLMEYNSLDLLDGDIYEYLSFCSDMHYFIEKETVILSHVGFSKGVIMPNSDTRALFGNDLVNISEDSIRTKKQIHGHFTRTLKDIQEALNANAQQLSIDGGCVFKDSVGLGVLVAVDLAVGKLFAQENIEKE